MTQAELARAHGVSKYLKGLVAQRHRCGGGRRDQWLELTRVEPAQADEPP